MKKICTAIMVSYKSSFIIERSIKSIGKNYPIIIIENSNDIDLKQKLENKYKNVTVVINKNNGYGKSINLGSKLTKTRFLLFTSPDVILQKKFFTKIIKIFIKLNKKNSLLLPVPFGQKINNIKKMFKSFGTPLMFLERQAFVKIGKFDENFFLYYEDQDLINRFIKANNDVYKIPLYFNHLGRSHDKKFNHSVELNRHWHYLWSRIYFIKKNNGYLAAFCLAMPVLTRSACKYVFFHFFNKEKSLIYKMRMLGAINSLLNKKSWYRPNM